MILEQLWVPRAEVGAGQRAGTERARGQHCPVLHLPLLAGGDWVSLSIWSPAPGTVSAVVGAGLVLVKWVSA